MTDPEPIVLSLGSSCLPRMILWEEIYRVENGIPDGLKITPFDFNQTPYAVLLEILASDMTTLRQDQLYTGHHPWYPDPVILNRDHENWVFPNEQVLFEKFAADDPETLLSLAYRSLVAQYRYFVDRVCCAGFVSFLVTGEGPPVELVDVIESRFPNLQFQILLLHHHQKSIDDGRGYKVIHSPYPESRHPSGRYDWWSDEVKRSQEGRRWQRQLGLRISELLPTRVN